MHKDRHSFKGVVAANVTPYDSDGNINEDAYRKVMEYDIQAGVSGFWIAGGAGEGVLLDDDERIRLAQISVDQAKGRAKTILHAGALTTRSTVKIAEGAAKAGVDAIACVPPCFYRPSDRAIIEHYKAVGSATGLPLFLYNWPGATGVEIMPPLMAKIADAVPELAGAKHSAPNLLNLRAFVNMGLVMFVGNSGTTLPALSIGAAGTIDGPPCVFPKEFVAIYDAYIRGDLSGAQQAQEKATCLRDAIFDSPAVVAYHAAFKAVLSVKLGVDCGVPRPPLLPLTEEQRQGVLSKLKELGGL